MQSRSDAIQVPRAEGRRTAADGVLDALERRATGVVVLLLVLFFILMVLTSGRKTVWFDEVSTAFLALQPDWKHFAGAMPSDGNPPLSGLLTGLSIRLFGLGPLALRLPEMLAVTGALAGLYVFVKRECGSLYGLLAMALVLSQPVWAYAFEARPYGLLLFFLMLALVGWQGAAHAVETSPSGRRSGSLLLLAVGIAGCILSHNIGVVSVGTPLLIGEAVRTVQRRRLDWGVIASSLVGLLALLITLPMIHRTRQAVLVHSTYIQPPYTLGKFYHYGSRIRDSAYLVLKPHAILVLVAAGVLWTGLHFILRKKSAGNHQPVRRASAYIVAGAIGLALLIPVTWLALVPAGGWYFCRYGIGTVLGCAVLVCLALAASGAGRTLVSLIIAVSLALFGYGCATYRTEFPLDQQFLATLRSQPDTTPILVADAFKFPPLWWNAAPRVRARLIYPTGKPIEVNTRPWEAAIDAGLTAERTYWQVDKPSLHPGFQDFAGYLHTHDRFLVLCYFPTENCLAPFLQQGFEAIPVDPTRAYFALHRKESPAALQ